jgi:hypothetical protein
LLESPRLWHFLCWSQDTSTGQGAFQGPLQWVQFQGQCAISVRDDLATVLPFLCFARHELKRLGRSGSPCLWPATLGGTWKALVLPSEPLKTTQCVRAAGVTCFTFHLYFVSLIFYKFSGPQSRKTAIESLLRTEGPLPAMSPL